MRYIYFVIIFLCMINHASAVPLTHVELDYRVCFTPQEDCTSLIVSTINDAQKSIYVQAYSFTSTPIMRALLAAHERGVDVKILLDKTQYDSKRYSSGRFFLNNNISVWMDDKPAVAHNKVMIIDDSIVITGSFNFTNAAQYRNTENLLIIKNDVIAQKYLSNWKSRWQQSRTLTSSHHKYRDRNKNELMKQYQKFLSVLQNN